MSQRHRTTEVPLPPKEEVRAHAHSERHRIHVELNHVASQVSAGLDPADVHEPGAAWKPVHHRDAEVAKTKAERTASGDPRLSLEERYRDPADYQAKLAAAAAELVRARLLLQEDADRYVAAATRVSW